MTLILVIIHYLFNYQNTQNRIDRAWINFLTPRAWNNPQGRPSKKWTQALEAAVLMYSDTQLLTGIAILFCAYSQLQRGISIFNWRITVQLAWFSSVTHLTTLTSLRAHFREHPVMAFWRVLFMGVMLLLLVIALVPTGYFSDTSGNTESYPAICLYSEGKLFPFNKPVVAFSLIILLTSYPTRVVKLFTPLSDLAHKSLRTAPGNFLKTCFDRTKRLRADSSGVMEKKAWTSLQFFLTFIYVLFKAIYDIGESMLWEVCTSSRFVKFGLILYHKIIWLMMALAWGTLRLVYLRRDVSLWNDNIYPDLYGKASEQKVWGFGQFLAIVLSTFPLWSIYTRIQGVVLFYSFSDIPLMPYDRNQIRRIEESRS